MLGRRCTNFIQMFCVYWVGLYVSIRVGPAEERAARGLTRDYALALV